MTNKLIYIQKNKYNIISFFFDFRNSKFYNIHVDILNEDGSFVSKDVEVGISDGINVEILKGINEGDKIKVWNSIQDEDPSETRRRQDENSRELED